MDKILPGHALSAEQQRHVHAALAMRDHDVKTYAEAEGLSYRRLLGMLRGETTLTPSYARKLSDLVRIHLVKPVTALAHAA